MNVTTADDVGAVGVERLITALLAVQTPQVTLCLSGGTSPDAVLDRLPGRLPADLLQRLVITWTDERVVPHSGDWTTWPAELNRRAAWARWLSKLELEDRPRERLLPAFAPIDVLLLGFGPDGHVASLFPGHPALDAVGDTVVVTDSPKPPPVRVSLTLDALRTARHVVGLAAGAAKGEVLRRVRDGDRELPLGRLGLAVDWVVDRDAASELTK